GRRRNGGKRKGGGSRRAALIPDYAALHPGYAVTQRERVRANNLRPSRTPNRSGLCSPICAVVMTGPTKNKGVREESMVLPFRAVIALAGMVGLLAAAEPARADPLQDLALAATKKGPVVWYESSPPEQILKVAGAFNKRYPDIKVQFVRNTGGGGIAARIIQEAEAGAATASFFIGDVAQVMPLNQRKLLLSADWKSLGVQGDLVTASYAVSSIAALGVLVWNTQQVADADLPKTWDE